MITCRLNLKPIEYLPFSLINLTIAEYKRRRKGACSPAVNVNLIIKGKTQWII